MTWTAPADLDPEVRVLCEAVNELPGVATVESCCGHGTQPFRIWLHVKNPDDLLPLLWAMDRCHSGQYGWTVRVYTDCAASLVTWMLEGPAGAYRAADVIAGVLRDETAAIQAEGE
jgi:hypothetical protein